MAEPSQNSDKKHSAEPKKDALLEDAPPNSFEEFVERAGGAYFEVCHRVARAINHLKGRRKKR